MVVEHNEFQCCWYVCFEGRVVACIPREEVDRQPNPHAYLFERVAQIERKLHEALEGTQREPVEDQLEEYDKRIAGIRTWRVHANKVLLSPIASATDPWMPGREVKAKCIFGMRHVSEAPDTSCKCGLYAFYSLDEWRKQARNHFNPNHEVIGIASGSERAILQERGFRAARMRVEAFIAPLYKVEVLGQFVSVRPQLDALAERYGVPVVEAEEVDAFCQIQDLQQLDSLEGKPSEMPRDHPDGRYYYYSGLQNSILPPPSFPGPNQIINVLKPQISSPKKPENMQESIEQKKHKDKFYKPLDQKNEMKRGNETYGGGPNG